MSPVAVGGVQGIADGGVEVRPAVDPAAVDGRHDRAHVPLAGAVVVLPQPRATGGTRTEVAADLGAVVPPDAVGRGAPARPHLVPTVAVAGVAEDRRVELRAAVEGQAVATDGVDDAGAPVTTGVRGHETHIAVQVAAEV